MMTIDRLIRSRRKSISVEITGNGEAVVHAPLAMPQSEIDAFILAHEAWITRKRREAAERCASAASMLAEGSLIPYLGGSLKLHYYEGRLPLRLDGELLLPKGKPAAFYEWRAAEAELLLRPRVAYWAGECGIAPTALGFGCAKARWGSMRVDGVMRLNTALVHCPMRQIDYVIVHELCHRRHPDHSPAFYAELRRLLPGADAVQAEMKKAGPPLQPPLPE